MNQKNLILIEENTFSFYEKLKKDLSFDKNIDIFTMSALFGKFIIRKRKPIKKVKSYIRLNDNQGSNCLPILKSLAIYENDDINLLNPDNDHELYNICEEYANAGIEELYKYYGNSKIKFNIEIGTLLNDKISEILRED